MPLPRPPAVPAAIVALAAVLAASGCGGGDGGKRDSRIRGNTLTVYMSTPRHGASAAGGEAAFSGARLALERAGGRAAGRRVRIVRMSSTRPGDARWDPGTVLANAERARDDPTAIAYLGELDLGGSAVSLPVTSSESLLQVSPSDGLTSLTRSPPGRPGAGPQRYYTGGLRTFLRLVPSDLGVARGLVRRARASGSRRPVVLHTDGIAERELAAIVAGLARRAGMSPVAVEAVRDDVDSVPELVADLAAKRPDAVVLSAVPGPASAALLAALGTSLPDLPVLCSPPMAASGTGLAGAPGEAVALTPAPGAEPRGKGRVLAALERRTGVPVRPEALLGYEAMRVVLDAVGRAGPDRRAVVRAALRPRERRSVLGRYRVRREGDVAGLGLRAVGLGGTPASPPASP